MNWTAAADRTLGLAHDARSRRAASLERCAAIVLGVALVYLAGFMQIDAVQDAMHDVRHMAALPRH